MMQPVRRGALMAAIAVLALVSAACGGGSGSSTAPDAGGGGEQAAAAPASVAVTLSDFKITPADIQVPAGAPVTFSVSNAGSMPHTFAVKTPDQTLDTGPIDAGASATLQVPALEEGTYDALCTIPGHDQLGMTATVTAGAGSSSAGSAGSGGMGTSGSMPATMPSMTAQQMADSHKAGVSAFPAKTEGTGNQVLEPTMDHGVKVFTLTATEVQWEVEPGVMKSAMAYNGQIPGPQLDLTYGDKVRIVLQNQLTQPTVLHFHGMTVPNEMDGVPYITQDPVMPGGYWDYEFTVKDPPGMYVYHSHFNSTEQVGKGLYGAIIIEPQGGRWPYRALNVDPRTGATSTGAVPKVDVESTMFLSDGPLGYVLNAKSFPATQPIVASKGDWVLIHLANDGSLLHPMHLHGYHFEVVGEDGFPLASPYMADTLIIAPGQRFDVLIHAVYPGAWAFHCHILPHVEGPQGMFGMVTALVVQ